MLNRCSPAFRPLVLWSVLGGVFLAAGGVRAHPPGENSSAFQIEVPEAQIAATDQPNVNLESTDVKLILVHILRPDADNIDYGQIFPKVNGAAASRISETRPGLNGKVLRLNLSTRPGFELLPGNNAIDVQATDHNGKVISATFNVHTPSGACRGGGRAKIFELMTLADLLHAGVAMERLIQLVVDCGVNFQPTSETDQKLQDLGAQPKLLAAIHNPAAPEFRGYQTNAIKLDQVLDLLHSRVAEEKIIASIEDNGVNFGFNPEVEEKLRAAGASQKLIQSVRYMAGAQAPQTEAQSLSLSQILHLLEGGAVAKDRLFSLVQQRGVNFRLDRATEDRLRGAGANEKLMRAIRDAADRYATTH
jgi:hypothetical protein